MGTIMDIFFYCHLSRFPFWTILEFNILFTLNKLGIKCRLEGNKIALNQLVCANIAIIILIYSFLAFRMMACGLHSSENIQVGKQQAAQKSRAFVWLNLLEITQNQKGHSK